MTIALNMIVGPYEEPFLEASLNSVKELLDECIIVDTAPGNNPNRQLIEDWIGKQLRVDYLDDEYVIIDMPRGEDKDFSFAEARELARVNTKSDWVLRLDADEVIHEKDIAGLKLTQFRADVEGYAAVEIAFYHFMVYPWLFQYIESKQILFRKDTFSWMNGVHELPKVRGDTLRKHNIKYFHYGYCRGQAEVFKRWKLYTDIDGRPTWYNGVNPDTILDDRISVCQNFNGTHPKVVEPTLDKLFPNWHEMYGE